MPVYHLQHTSDGGFSEIGAVPAGSVLLLGYFDGVHLGHAALIWEARDYDRECPAAVWTPEAVPKASAEQGLLTTRAEKLRRFGNLGVSYAVIDRFEEIRHMDGEDFFRHHIMEQYRPCAVVCGENFRFGRNAACTARDLEKFAREAGIGCRVIPLLGSVMPGSVIPGEESAPVSSTEIRRLIASGEIEEANRLLGYPYSVEAEIVHGKALGRTIGCPTINQRLPEEKIMPQKGVYACTAEFVENGRAAVYPGVCNIGSRPTVNRDKNDITLETYIIGFSGDLYGKTVRTSLYGKIRGEKTFASVEELSKQIHEDAAAAVEILKRTKN